MSGGATTGCDPSDHDFVIASVTPSQAFSDTSVILRVGVDGLRPPLRLDVGSGTLSADFRMVRLALLPELGTADGDAIPVPTVAWDGQFQDAFWGQVPPQLPPGRYSVQLTDPRGKSSTLPDAFESLGPDDASPEIYLDPPLLADAVFGSETAKTYVVVDDAQGVVANVHWETSYGHLGDCPGWSVPQLDGQSVLPAQWRGVPPTRLYCELTITEPNFEDSDPATLPFVLYADGRDVAGHQVSLELPLRFARPPTVAGFLGTAGALAGQQPFVVRGRNFLPGTQAFLDGIPLGGAVPGGEVLDDDGGGAPVAVGQQMIVGLTPPRGRPGPVTVLVRSPAGTDVAKGFFDYIAPPLPRDVQPTTGSPAGGTQVTVRGNDLRKSALIYVGHSRESRQLLSNLRYETGNKIVGCMPPGNGTVTVWVEDAVTGEGSLPDAFTYDDATAPPATASPACR